MAEIEFLPPPRSSSEASERVDSLQASTAPIPTSTGDGASATARASSPHELTPDELEQAHRIFASEGAAPPDPANSILIGTTDSNGLITSFIGVQPMVHIDPLWISPGAEHELRGLIQAAESAIRARLVPGAACKVFVFAPDGRVARMAELNQMSRESWTVYSKVIQNESGPIPPGDNESTFKARPIPIAVPDPGPVLDDTYQSRPDESAWEPLFPNGVLAVDPSGRIQ